MTKISKLTAESMQEDYKTMTLEKISEKYGVSVRMAFYYCGKKQDAGIKKCLNCRVEIPGRRLSNLCKRCYSTLFARVRRVVEKEKMR